MRERVTKDVGLAIIGGGRVGLFRGEVAARHPAIEWIGLAEKNPNRAGEVGPKINADFVTQNHIELLRRPEVTAAIICTDEHLHVDPIMAAVERGIPMLIEKPLATNLAQSAKVLKAIQDAKLDAVVGYTQRFRRRWLAAKEKCRSGALGDAISDTFGDAEQLRAAVNDAGVKRFGSGWTWLVWDGTGLAVKSTPNQDNPLMDSDDVPLLGIDVWEHAYYLKYQNRRPDYLAAWWDVVNWDEVGKRFGAAR